MSDPLGHVESGPPCPSCGHRVTLGALRRTLRALHRRKAALPKRIPPIAPGAGITLHGSQTLSIGAVGDAAIDSDVLNPLSIDGEICAKCGTIWKPDAVQEADEARAEIKSLRLELESAIDLLGRVPREDG